MSRKTLLKKGKLFTMTTPITTTYKVDIIPIYEDVHSALVIYGAATVEQHNKYAAQYNPIWDEDNPAIYASRAVPGLYNLVLKVGGNIDMHASLAQHGLEFVDDSLTEVRSMD